MQTIAVLGASHDRRKYGNKCVRAYAHAGYRVFPIHPTETEVEGFPAFAKLAEIAEPLDRISVYLPPPITLSMLPDIAAKGAGEVWFNPGSADTRVLEEARRRGLSIRPGCSIVDIGLSPAMFGE
ncbi:MAG TPA: CoA-binding protein [Thermoanaerobaculia bacterium]|nr:CoA-binding protein [Thermoanaerobaculia bacterium]